MEYLYTANKKIIQGATYYFVKKLMALPEIKGVPEIVIGYGMLIDFEKACSIAGIYDTATRQLLLLDLEPAPPVEKPLVKHHVQIPASVNRELIELATEALN